MSNQQKNAPSTEQWKELYAAAAELKKLEPWKGLRDTNLVVIELPGQDEPMFCSVMGQGDTSYGVAVYPGYVAFGALDRLLSCGPDEPPILHMMEQRCLSCNFGDREDVTPEDRAVMKELGLRFRGRGQWIFFRTQKPGFFPWYLDAEEAELLARTLRQLLAICRAHAEGEVTADFEGGELLRRYQEDGEWKNGAVALSSIPSYVPVYTLRMSDDPFIERMKKKKKNRTKVEIEFGHLPIPFQESKNEPPAAPYVTILFDRDSGALLNQDFSPSGDVSIPPNVLLRYIEQCGRPAAVFVRDPIQAGPLKLLCETLGIRLVSDKGMECTSKFFSMLMDTGFLGGDAGFFDEDF